VPVTRFASRSGRAPDFDEWGRPLLAAPESVVPADAEEWVRRQGPWSPELADAAADGDADLLVFYPYLYAPTVVGVRRSPERAVLHPAAHDEPALRLPVFGGVFAAARALVFQTDGERALVQRLFPVAATAQILLGLGIEEGEGGRLPAELAGRPFLVCLGRVDRGKGTDVLARFFARYKARRPGPLALVFAGPVVHQPPEHPDVVVLGAVDDEVKWGLLAGATALVSPSAYEAFSLVVLEAFDRSTPVLVNAGCAATAEHALASGAGLTFDGYAAFEVALDRLTGAPELAARMGERGRAYVEAGFRWPSVIDRYLAFLTDLLS
jgi:glycosyltransferase involved in cell wall biosynthesis